LWDFNQIPSYMTKLTYIYYLVGVCPYDYPVDGTLRLLNL